MITFARHHAFLVVELVEGSTETEHIVRLDASLQDVVATWKPSTRISPIFGITEKGTADPAAALLDGQQTLIFIGPVAPAPMIAAADDDAIVWLSLGVYNVVVLTQEWGIPKWLPPDDDHTRREVWFLENGTVQKVQSSPARVSADNRWRQTLLKIARHADRHEILADSIHEYCALMASAIARCEQILPAKVDDLVLANAELLDDLTSPDDDDDYLLVSELTAINAALSRFTSQAFSGTTPILETECHFWTHSLLGTGVANLALSNLERFIRVRLGSQRLHARFDHLQDVRDDVPNLRELPRDSPLWTDTDYLDSAELTREDMREPIFPVITYLSGRDGFKSTEHTLSAPLAVISSCNSTRWSLMTLTHEISHIFVKGFLGSLYFDANSEKQLRAARKLLGARGCAENLLDEVRRYLLHAIMDLERVERRGTRADSINLDLALTLDKWHHEVEEILVHTFDFLYFYGRSYNRYVNGIWTSWGVVPNIANRVPEYVMRTLCVLLSLYLREEKSVDRARDMLLQLLEHNVAAAQARRDDPRYVKNALKYLANSSLWKSEIRPRLIARLPLTRIARTFFYSEAAAFRMGAESRLAGNATAREGYSFKIGRYEGGPITNPLKFIEQYTDFVKPSDATSAWLLYILAFNVSAME